MNTNPKIFRICDYDNILCRFASDAGIKVDPNFPDDGIREVINDNKFILDHITLIAEVKNAKFPNIQTVSLKDKTYLNISVKTLNHMIDSGIVEFSKIKNYLPSVLFDDSTGVKMKRINLDNPNLYPNSGDNILYISDLSYLEEALSVGLNMFSNDNPIDDIYNMYNITLRLSLPYYIIDRIVSDSSMSKNIFGFTFIPLMRNGSIVFSNNTDLDKETKLIVDEANELSCKLYKNTYNYYYLPLTAVYSCYITCTLKGLNDIVKLYTMEKNTDTPTISMMYYFLLNYKNIYNCIKRGVDEDSLMKNIFPDKR